MFTGFPKDTIPFLSELTVNNDKDWFEANKPRFKNHIEPASQSFLETVSEGLSDLTKTLMTGKLFRMYRDIRFSKDKTPYNTHIRMMWYPAAGKGANCDSHPAFYFSLDPETVILGAGNFEFSKEKLIDYRNAIANDKTGQELELLLRNYTKKEGFYTESPTLKRVPSGFEPTHPHAALLKTKGLTIWQKQIPSQQIETDTYLVKSMETFARMKPIYDWINTL